jgi:acetyl-CoA acetyltransferase
MGYVSGEELAEVAVTHRYHATLNPDSIMGRRGPITVEGEGAAYFAEGHTRLGGKIPCNTDGGLLSNSHCTYPSGMHTIEVVRQLRGECGDRQVPDARIGVSLAQGMAVHGHAGTLIMARD